MPPRSRRDKSASISSSIAEAAGAVNGSMPPPSPPPRSSPATRRKTSLGKSGLNAPSIPAPQSTFTPKRPSILKYLLAVLISLVAEAAAHTLASTFHTGELAIISRRNPSPYTTAGLITWKSTLLAIYWFGGFDAVDVASLTTILQTPIFVLLHYFYNISAFTLVTTHTISILSPALPFYLLRPLSAPHSSITSPLTRSNRLRNRTIIFDPVTTLATSITTTIFLATTLAASCITFLPTFLIIHFNGLRDLTFAHDISSNLPKLLIWLFPAGVASTQFLFRPAEGATPPNTSTTATGPNSLVLTRTPSHFDPETATFTQHVYHNTWGWYTSRQKELIGRTITLGALLVLETTVTAWGTIEGVEVVGAIVYAGVWLGGVIVSGVFLDWVGGPSD